MMKSVQPRMGFEYVQKMQMFKDKTDKDRLFSLLFKAAPNIMSPKNVKDLATEPKAIENRSCDASLRMCRNQVILQRLNQKIAKGLLVSEDSYRSFMPSEADYLHIAMNYYYKAGMGKNFVDFCSDYQQLRQERKKGERTVPLSPMVQAPMQQQNAVSY